MNIFLLAAGFVLLIKGAEWLIEGSCSIANRAGVSQLIIGLTLVSFGTSLPEFFINIMSRLSGNADITLGDILGSNIANILLVLGLTAAVRPLLIKQSTMKWEIPFAVAAAIALWSLANGKIFPDEALAGLTRKDGFILLTLFALFIFYIALLGRSEAADKEVSFVHECPLSRSISMIIIGIPCLAMGAKGVVKGGSAIALAFGVPESVIGLTIIAVGTSLPELVTSVLAAMKKRSDIAVGNVVGSNIFNICWILGLSAFVSPLAIPQSYLMDIAVIIAVTLILFLSAWLGRGMLNRLNGLFFLLLYVAYVASLAIEPQRVQILMVFKGR